MVSQLVLVRHGQSIYNEQNKFTGWADVELTSAGLQEAVKASSTPCYKLHGWLQYTHKTSHSSLLGCRPASS